MRRRECEKWAKLWREKERNFTELARDDERFRNTRERY